VNLDEAIRRFDLARWLRKHRFRATGAGHREWLTDCPFCGAQDKYSVTTADKLTRQPKWRCFVCALPCSFVQLIAAFEGSKARAIEVILEGVGHRAGGLEFIPDFLEDVDDELHRPPGWEPAPIEVPPGFVPLTQHLPYTARRRMNLDSLIALGAGYCTSGRYGDRLVFPVRRYPDGAWLYFQTRAMWEKSEARDPSRYLKNLNPKLEEGDRIHAAANDVLLGLELVVAYGLKRVALVEGPTDWQAVGVGAVASFGKKLSPRQLQLLVHAGVTDVDMAWDADAWEPPTRKLPDGRVELTGKPPPAMEACSRLAMVFNTRVVRYPDGFDPGDYSPADNALWRASGVSYGGGRLAQIP
jgi:hypothetical protein